MRNHLRNGKKRDWISLGHAKMKLDVLQCWLSFSVQKFSRCFLQSRNYHLLRLNQLINKVNKVTLKHIQIVFTRSVGEFYLVSCVIIPNGFATSVEDWGCYWGIYRSRGGTVKLPSCDVGFGRVHIWLVILDVRKTKSYFGGVWWGSCCIILTQKTNSTLVLETTNYPHS